MHVCVCVLARQRNFAVLTLRLITMINLKKVHLVAQPVPVSGGSRVHPFEASYSDQNETEKRSTQSRPPPNEIGCSQRTQIRHGKGGVPFAFLSFGRALDETRDKPPQPSRTAGRGSAGRTYFSSALLGPSTWIALGGTAPPPPRALPNAVICSPLSDPGCGQRASKEKVRGSLATIGHVGIARWHRQPSSHLHVFPVRSAPAVGSARAAMPIPRNWIFDCD